MPMPSIEGRLVLSSISLVNRCRHVTFPPSTYDTVTSSWSSTLQSWHVRQDEAGVLIVHIAKSIGQSEQL